MKADTSYMLVCYPGGSAVAQRRMCDSIEEVQQNFRELHKIGLKTIEVYEWLDEVHSTEDGREIHTVKFGFVETLSE